MSPENLENTSNFQGWDLTLVAYIKMCIPCDFFQNHGFNFKVNTLSANFTKWSNTLKQFVGKLPTNCLKVFDHSVGLELKGLSSKLNKPGFVFRAKSTRYLFLELKFTTPDCGKDQFGYVCIKTEIKNESKHFLRLHVLNRKISC